MSLKDAKLVLKTYQSFNSVLGHTSTFYITGDYDNHQVVEVFPDGSEEITD